MLLQCDLGRLSDSPDIHEDISEASSQVGYHRDSFLLKSGGGDDDPGIAVIGAG